MYVIDASVVYCVYARSIMCFASIHILQFAPMHFIVLFRHDGDTSQFVLSLETSLQSATSLYTSQDVTLIGFIVIFCIR